MFVALATVCGVTVISANGGFFVSGMSRPLLCGRSGKACSSERSVSDFDHGLLGSSANALDSVTIWSKELHQKGRFLLL
jgi:hypothetical protein